MHILGDKHATNVARNLQAHNLFNGKKRVLCFVAKACKHVCSCPLHLPTLLLRYLC
ncbi:hypothetical protein POPTR_006G183466v4 [Populus trichocarpa]|uniref:Uncharacterized protein n=1 Tax=Populus trichocarpa TaxID=3694 RepID=A0ACC0SV81_POPTR|nr:hypothetical protein POPTR_006G183466v4 [Populus trichocarpa]